MNLVKWNLLDWWTVSLQCTDLREAVELHVQQMVLHVPS